MSYNIFFLVKISLSYTNFLKFPGVSNPWGVIVLGVTNPVESISPGSETLACQYPWGLIARESISSGSETLACQYPWGLIARESIFPGVIH